MPYRRVRQTPAKAATQGFPNAKMSLVKSFGTGPVKAGRRGHHFYNQRCCSCLVTDWILAEPVQVEVMDPAPKATETFLLYDPIPGRYAWTRCGRTMAPGLATAMVKTASMIHFLAPATAR